MDTTQNKKERIDQLEQRILRWVVAVMGFIGEVEKNTASVSITRQLADSVGSTGANFVEARAGRSKKEFSSSMGIAAKECKESLFWLRVLREARLAEQIHIDVVGKEGNEIAAILTSICIRSKNNIKDSS